MYDQFRWTNVSARRNGLTMEYEPLQPFFFVALAEAAGCTTILDIGANIGAYSLFGTRASTVERVVAFEANPETIKELRVNVTANGLEDRIRVEGKAVSSESGPVSFGVVSSFSGANSVVKTSIHDSTSFHKQIRVEAIRLDDYFSSMSGQRLAIKVDVEGHEAAVIQGARTMLRSNQAVIQLEGYENGKTSALAELERLGYARLTGIGPDHYFTNIDTFESARIVCVYEQAVQQLIAYNHRNKAVLLKRGDFGLQLTGRAANLARNVAKRLIGKRL